MAITEGTIIAPDGEQRVRYVAPGTDIDSSIAAWRDKRDAAAARGDVAEELAAATTIDALQLARVKVVGEILDASQVLEKVVK